ncbi:hypothetical protein [uncultured Polaribacter sp.]|nr:hypothetical protein [uncultured Polaribacter sp.]
MDKYLEIIKQSYSDYWNYIKQSVLMELNWENYFYLSLQLGILTLPKETW